MIEVDDVKKTYLSRGGQTVEEVIKEAVGTLGENIRVGRFTRFTLGGE